MSETSAEIVLTVTRPEMPAGDATPSVRFGAEGGTVGRSTQNDMVLPDPTNMVSRRHFEVLFREGQFEVVDHSANGLYLNGAADPIGQGRSAVLKPGDRLALGDYEVSVERIATGDADTMGTPAAPLPVEKTFSGNPFATGGAEAAPPARPAPPAAEPGGGGRDPFGLPEGLSRDPFAEIAQDAEREIDEDDDWPPRGFDQVAPSIGGDAPEQDAPLIPDSYDPLADLDESRAEPIADHAPGWNVPISNVMRPAEPEPAPPPPEPVPAPPPPPVPATGDAMAAFWQAAGLDPKAVQSALGPEAAGALFGALVRGLWEILRARTAFKEEFRVERTMLGAQNNNPVKFAIDAEQALEALARPPSRGFMAGQEAVDESFDDIRRHEMAMLAAMHRALSHVLEEFDPEALESKLEGMSLLDALPGGRRARYWDLYVKHYAELARKAEDIFEGALGREFVAAYERASGGSRGGEDR